MTRRLSFVCMLVALLSGDARGGAPVPGTPTFTEHIAPLVYEKCAGCHRDGMNAPFTLLTYAQVKKRALQLADVTEDRVMPPWHADRGVVEYANDRSLNEDQIALLRRWVEAGAPEGDPAKLPPLPKFPEGWQLGEPDFSVQMAEEYSVPAEGPDTYRNFVVPLNLTEDTWVNAIEFKPGAPSVVHHVLYFLDTSGKARKNDAADPEPGYNGMGRSNGHFRYLGGWDLGTQTAALRYDLAWLLPKGADLVLQVHYHPNGKKAQKDRSTLGFHVADKPTARPWTIVPVPPFFGIMSGINIPAGEKEYIKESSMVLPVDIEAIAVNAHAHYLGKRMEMTATLPNGEKHWLLKMSDWNFAWQEDYAFKQPVKLPAGTRLDALISWDNSESNPYQFAKPPRPVGWGPTSTDEMGTLTLTVMLNTPEEKKALHTALKRTLTGQFIQRIFEQDTTGLDAVRSQVSSELPMPKSDKLMKFRALTLPLDLNRDGKLDIAELQPGIDFVLPMMNGFGEIGID
ncbi:MAG: hypothetical protein EOP84_05220 [Verrucomicrobiaceae bacterium]|nr:MAG: hypothetical protein EOP84_05220 [Verrucomicrobiaceae bacterium]